jgi:hypothetical protein
MKKEKHIVLEDETIEERDIKLESGKTLNIKYTHHPNIVGPRSKYTGLPIWVGKTEALGRLVDQNDKPGFAKSSEAFCWLQEPYDYSQARVVTTGRLLKAFNQSTKLADQVKD